MWWSCTPGGPIGRQWPPVFVRGCALLVALCLSIGSGTSHDPWCGLSLVVASLVMFPAVKVLPVTAVVPVHRRPRRGCCGSFSGRCWSSGRRSDLNCCSCRCCPCWCCTPCCCTLCCTCVAAPIARVLPSRPPRSRPAPGPTHRGLPPLHLQRRTGTALVVAVVAASSQNCTPPRLFRSGLLVVLLGPLAPPG